MELSYLIVEYLNKLDILIVPSFLQPSTSALFALAGKLLFVGV